MKTYKVEIVFTDKGVGSHDFAKDLTYTEACQVLIELEKARARLFQQINEFDKVLSKNEFIDKMVEK